MKTVFYILQSFREMINRNYYPGGCSHYTDTWYFKFHRKILNIFKKHPSYRFVIKLPSGFAAYSLYLQMIEQNKHVRLCQKPLLKVIHEADFFIIDSLATSIVQCAATRAPILAYCGEHCKKPSREALFFLRKRAMCAETAEDFFSNINLILTDPSQYKRDVDNSEFLEHFGINDLKKEVDWIAVLDEIILTTPKDE
jgi:hypothetical protein